jgi:glycosyltransferase involved in cell wall biosynthesis
MKRAAELSVIIPVYNEEESLENAVRRVRRFCPGSELIVVDDGSGDRTAGIAKRLGVVLVSHDRNRGYGAALKTGFSRARGEYVAFLDADMTYDPRYIPVLLDRARAGGLDVAWGNRFGTGKNRMPAVRKLGNRIISLVMLLVTGKRVRDCASGERLIKRDALGRLGVGDLPDDLDFITGLTKRIVSRGLRYREIPIDYDLREGKSKLRIFRHGYRMVRNIIKY